MMTMLFWWSVGRTQGVMRVEPGSLPLPCPAPNTGTLTGHVQDYFAGDHTTGAPGLTQVSACNLPLDGSQVPDGQQSLILLPVTFQLRNRVPPSLAPQGLLGAFLPCPVSRAIPLV